MANSSSPWDGKIPSFDELPYYTPPSRQPVYVRRPKGGFEEEEESAPSISDQRLVERQQMLQAIFGSSAPAVHSAIDAMSSPTGRKVSGVAVLAVGTVLLTKIS